MAEGVRPADMAVARKEDDLKKDRNCAVDPDQEEVPDIKKYVSSNSDLLVTRCTNARLALD